jgi:hypothetical protein
MQCRFSGAIRHHGLSPLSKYLAAAIYKANRNFCATDVDAKQRSLFA